MQRDQDPPNTVPNHVVNDVLVNFTDTFAPPSLTGQQMILNLTQGTVFGDSLLFGSNIPPNAALFAVEPGVKFDSFVAMGGPTSASSSGILIAGGAVDLEAGSAQKFDSSGISIAWAPGTGIVVPPQADYLTARITLSNNAMGSFKYFGSTADGTELKFENGTIANGVISFGIIPPDDLPPVGIDETITRFITQNINYQFGATDGDSTPGQLTWSNLVFSGAGVGGAASLSPTGGFNWLAGPIGTQGMYTATATVTDQTGLTDTATLTIDVQIPEPSSIALVGLAIVGLAGCARRRS